MENLSDINVIKSVLSKNGFTFSKALGQNFLINPSVCPRMAEAAIDENNMGVIEVGPGIGVLTNELAKCAKKVVSVELDKRLLPVLDETLKEYDNVEIINDDVMKINLHELMSEKFSGMKVAVCANLPYYITTPIIMNLLESRIDIESITVMVQKEAAQRLSAKIGSRESGAITVAVNYYCEVETLFQVSRGSFMPAPNVDSSVIKLIRRKEPPIEVENEKIFFKIVRAAFEQRRKTALNAISATTQFSKESVSKALEYANVSQTIRGEKCTLQNFADIANFLVKGE